MAQKRQTRPESGLGTPVKARFWLWQDSQGQILALVRQSKPDSGLGCQVKVLETFEVVPSSLGSGTYEADRNYYILESTSNIDNPDQVPIQF